MSLSRLFVQLGAPLKNIRWSWGARRARDGVVFLRVWSDHKHRNEHQLYVMVDSHTPTIGRGPGKNLGYEERVRHIEAIRRGADCYMVVCDPDGPHGTQRGVRAFNSETLLVGGGVVDLDGKTYIKVIGTRRAEDLIAK